MSTSCIDETAIQQARYYELRKIEVQNLVKKHSNKLFGHSNSTISEIRSEAIRRNLEAAFKNS